jgi:hypothetical protein
MTRLGYGVFRDNECDDAFVERVMIRINQLKPNFVPTVVWTNPDRRAQ